jgi:hypothetical protein
VFLTPVGTLLTVLFPTFLTILLIGVCLTISPTLLIALTATRSSTGTLLTLRPIGMGSTILLPSSVALLTVGGIRAIGLAFFRAATTTRSGHLFWRLKAVGLSIITAGRTVVGLLTINLTLG